MVMFSVGFGLGTLNALIWLVVFSFRPLKSDKDQPILDVRKTIRQVVGKGKRKPIAQTEEKAYEREIQEQGETRG